MNITDITVINSIMDIIEIIYNMGFFQAFENNLNTYKGLPKKTTYDESTGTTLGLSIQ